MSIDVTRVDLGYPFQGGTYFVDQVSYLCLVFVMLSRLFIAALWSLAGKGLTSWLLLVMSNRDFVRFPMWYPGPGVVLDCIDSRSLPSFLLLSFETLPLLISKLRTDSIKPSMLFSNIVGSLYL